MRREFACSFAASIVPALPQFPPARIPPLESLATISRHIADSDLPAWNGRSIATPCELAHRTISVGGLRAAIPRGRQIPEPKLLEQLAGRRPSSLGRIFSRSTQPPIPSRRSRRERSTCRLRPAAETSWLEDRADILRRHQPPIPALPAGTELVPVVPRDCEARSAASRRMAVGRPPFPGQESAVRSRSQFSTFEALASCHRRLTSHDNLSRVPVRIKSNIYRYTI